MSHHIAWFAAAAILIAAEMMTGTFYLLVFGLAAAATALLSWIGAPGLGIELGLFSILSIAGAVGVKRYRNANPTLGAPKDSDEGNTVQLLRPNPHDKALWRVAYRGAEWDARIEDGAPVKGAGARITAKDGNILRVIVNA